MNRMSFSFNALPEAGARWADNRAPLSGQLHKDIPITDQDGNRLGTGKVSALSFSKSLNGPSGIGLTMEVTFDDAGRTLDHGALTGLSLSLGDIPPELCEHRPRREALKKATDAALKEWQRLVPALYPDKAADARHACRAAVATALNTAHPEQGLPTTYVPGTTRASGETQRLLNALLGSYPGTLRMAYDWSDSRFDAHYVTPSWTVSGAGRTPTEALQELAVRVDEKMRQHPPTLDPGKTRVTPPEQMTAEQLLQGVDMLLADAHSNMTLRQDYRTGHFMATYYPRPGQGVDAVRCEGRTSLEALRELAAYLARTSKAEEAWRHQVAYGDAVKVQARVDLPPLRPELQENLLPEGAKDACPDGGTCWHYCPKISSTGKDAGLPCWRVLHAGPFTGTYSDDTADEDWPEEISSAHRQAHEERLRALTDARNKAPESLGFEFTAPRGPDRNAHQLDPGEYDILFDTTAAPGTTFAVFDVTNSTPLIWGMSAKNLRALVLDSTIPEVAMRAGLWVKGVTLNQTAFDLRPEVAGTLSPEVASVMRRIGTLYLTAESLPDAGER
jgi:hypothetical protein